MLITKTPLSAPWRRIQNHARGQFVDDYVELVQALEARMERSQMEAYEGMYNHVRPLMVTGAILASGGIAAFAIAPAVAPALVASAALVGYLPWFATTVAHFEREDMEAAVPSGLFSREDFSSPLTMLVKTSVLFVAAPVAGLIFFIPYGLYAGAVRPLGRLVCRALVHGACLAYVYVIQPGCEVLQLVGPAVIDAVAAGAKSLYEFVLRPLGAGATWLWRQFADAAHWTLQNALVPAWNGVRRCVEAAYLHILQPGAEAFCSIVQAVGNASYTYILSPAGTALVTAGQGLARMLTLCAEGLYGYVLVPVGQAAWAGMKMTGQSLALVAHGLSEYVLAPAASGTVAAMRCIGQCMVAGAEGLYGYVLQPLASGAYFYVLVPAERAVRAAAGGVWHATCASAWAVGELASLCYAIAILPCLKAAVSMAGATYVYVVLPCGQAFVLSAKAAGQGVQAAATTVAEAVQAIGGVVYVHVVSPVGEVSKAAFHSTQQALQQTGNTVRTTFQSLARSMASVTR